VTIGAQSILQRTNRDLSIIISGVKMAPCPMLHPGQPFSFWVVVRPFTVNKEHPMKRSLLLAALLALAVTACGKKEEAKTVAAPEPAPATAPAAAPAAEPATAPAAAAAADTAAPAAAPADTAAPADAGKSATDEAMDKAKEVADAAAKGAADAAKDTMNK
jgi:hypothetical protein